MNLMSLCLLCLHAVSAIGPQIAQFRCDDGLQSIPLKLRCNGILDCLDGSDERLEVCSRSRCWSHRWFRCGGGGCIPRSKRCDNNIDCWDASDEALCPTIVLLPCRYGWQCSSGSCVPQSALCNGTAECQDGSDETAEICSNAIQCPEFTFRCNSGGCVSQLLICDGILHCLDGSDEDPELCSKTTGNCQVPTVSPPLHVSVPGCQGSCPDVSELEAIQFSCDSGYELVGEPFLLCVDTMWQPPDFPVCVPKNSTVLNCPGLAIAPEVNGTCTSNSGEVVSCSSPQKIGTRAKIYCLQNSQQIVDSVCQSNGNWSATPPVCTPECGIAPTSDYHRKNLVWWRNVPQGPNLGWGPLIVNGSISSPGQWPWQAALYVQSQTSETEMSWKFQCGGTLVSDTAVITAAHCVYRKLPNVFQVVMGKYRREYNITEPGAQYIQIREILLPETYIGDVNGYDSDIAMLILEDRANFNPRVRPICLDWQQMYAKTLLTAGNSGILAGWGVTETDMVSDALRYARLDFVPVNECLDWIKPDFKRYIRATTFCAGTRNNTAACNGDSGGGLMFAMPHTRAWTLQGVVSLSIRRDFAALCDTNFPTVFTRVSSYMNNLILPWMYQAAQPWIFSDL